MENQEEIQKAFIAYLVQDAAKQGIQLQSEQDLQAYAQKLGKEGLKSKYKEFMSKMQGGTMARLGAKLEYYKKLKGTCPEGEQLVYFKKGGQLCKACQKAQNGEKIDQNKNEVEKFKQGQQQKKQQKRLDPNTTKKLPGGKYPSYWTSQERQTWERKYGQYDDGAAATSNKGIGKNKQGGLLIPKHKKGNPIKKYRVVFLGDNSKYNREFDTEAEAIEYRKSKGLPAKFIDQSTAWQGDVLRADRSKDKSTAYARQEAEKPYNKLSFADANKLARKNGDRWFAYKGKVYDSGLKKGEYKKDNLNYMKQLYGNYLGWKGNSKLHTNASKKGREKQNSELDAKTARPYDPEIDGPITNKGASEKADREAIKVDPVEFVDLMMPDNYIGNTLDAGASSLMDEPYTYKTHKSGLNLLGWGQDAVTGNVAGLGERGLSLISYTGAPWIGKGLNYLGTKFAPKIAALSEKSRYIPMKALDPVMKGGKRVGSQLNKWSTNALKGSEPLNEFGRRSIERATKDGTLDMFRINGGMNNAAKWGTRVVQNPKTGTAYIYRNSVNGVPIGNAYDQVVDAAVEVMPKAVQATGQLLHPVFRLEDEPVVVEARKQGGLLRKKQ